LFQGNENLKHFGFLSAIVFLQAIVYVSVIFDITILRQVIGFLYITFIPGYLIVKLLKFHFGILETVIFSVGFSITFLMLAGLFLNELGFMAGIVQPLSAVPLLVALNMFVSILSILVHLRGESHVLLDEVSLGSVKLTFPLILPLVFSIVGAMLVNIYGDNSVLLIMILSVSLIMAILTFKSKVPDVANAFAVLVIGISLLYHSSLVSKYLITFGSDVMVEHFVFRSTLEEGFWNSNLPFYWDVETGRLNSMLSITILPTIYSVLLNLNSTWIFKIVFPLFFALVPLSLYQLWKKCYEEKWAFASATFFMATSTFYSELLGLNRQMIGELFFALLLLILLNEKTKHFQRLVAFTLLSFSLVVSHYALAEIFLLMIIFALIFSYLLKRQNNNGLKTELVVLFFVIMFVWYIYTSDSSVFDSFVNYGEYVYQRVGEFFKIESREETILRGLGLENPPTIWNAISRFFAYMTEFLIIVGFVSIILKRTIRWNHFIFVVVAMGFLVLLVLIPGLSDTLNMTRFYHILLFFLAPLCTLGGNVIASIIYKPKKEVFTSILLISILVPYFLFQSGFIYEITKSQSWSLPLSLSRLGIRLHANFGIVTESEVSGAQWLSHHSRVKNSVLFADFHIFSALIGYGMINDIIRLTNTSKLKEGSYIYLGTLNVIYELIIDYDVWNITEVLNSSNFRYSNKLFSNGNCEIYKVCNP
jgi:uncharacterized membrane protein